MRRVSGIVDLPYAHMLGIKGQGITAAMIDSGISVHSDFERDRLIEAVDFVNGRKDFYDDNGHGTHVAGIIGSNGPYFKGMAPEVKLISVKVLNKKGDGRINDMLNGLSWIENNYERYNIRIVNISIGTPVNKHFDENSSLIKQVEHLWNLGIVVVCAAGNNGPKAGSVGAPGISRKVITVGAYDNIQTYRNFSGRGPTASCIKKPDIVAPGSKIYSCNNAGGRRKYTYKSGTSMATPVVSGAICLLLTMYPNMTNKDVKIRLKETAVDLGLSHSLQGWGMINVKRLLEG